MAAHDLLLRTGGTYDTIGKAPYLRTAGVDYSTADGYQVWVNNSLEGALFDDSSLGYVSIAAGNIHPNFNLNYTESLGATHTISSLSRKDGIVSVVTTTGHGLVANDLFSLKAVVFDASHPAELNGVFKVFQKISSTEFTFIKHGADFDDSVGYHTAVNLKLYDPDYPAMKIFDNRQSFDASGLSYNGILFSPYTLTGVGGTKRKITSSDLYIRFNFTDSTEAQGGLNSNIFNVIDDTANENVKPIIWAWFFGGITKATDGNFLTADRVPYNMFDIIFNSYAVVLRPTGSGSYLEFALLKFNWGEIEDSTWFTNFIDTALINQYADVDGADLGYLIATNPNVAQISNETKITEIATSSPFLYDSEKPLKLNIKISIRKHLLSDQPTEDSYYFQLGLNSDYETFGDAANYSNVMHAFIKRPRTNGLTVTTFASGGYVSAISTDVGKTVLDGATPVGTLSWYDNLTRTWWIRGVSDTIVSSTALTISTGTGAGTTNINSYDDTGLAYINPLSDDTTDQRNFLLLPWMYFKFINVNSSAYGEDSSSIIVDNILFRQLNSANKLYY